MSLWLLPCALRIDAPEHAPIEGPTIVAAGRAEKLRAAVLEKVEQNSVVVFARSECPSGDAARECFEALGIPYVSIEVGQGSTLERALSTSADTLPRIYIHGMPYSGAEIAEKCRSGLVSALALAQ